MNLSFSWLKQHVKLPDSITPFEVAEKLKLSTVEVEGIVDQAAGLDKVVVGKVLKAEKHPNADKLKVCEVDLGSEKVTIVCGGSNVTEGMLAAVAKNGAKVKWHGEGDLIELKPTTIRGVESNGMICGADEIGLAAMFPKKDEKEIVDLSHLKVKPGTALAVALKLDGAVLEIDNKSLSNRPDLWGHYGMAREVAVLTNRDVEKYETQEIKKAINQEIKIKVHIEDTKLCPRYMAVAMSGIKVEESPAWLKERLTSVGLRPINNIVDITNYVMLDLGQPMHAFDARQLTINKQQLTKLTIEVKRANEGEKFITLDGAEHTLTGDMLVIANEEKPVALAGVMGGQDSGIANDTTAIVFESANFDAASVRKTSTKLGIRTDSSARFEKSLDPNLCQTALEKAVGLVLEICPGAKVASSVVDEKHFRLATGPLEVPLEFFTKKIGIDIPVKTIVTILTRLGFTVTEKKKSLAIKIPTWRATKDISIAEDIVEEVLRIYGYDNVPAALPTFTITPPAASPLRDLEYTVRDMMVEELGYTEVYNYSFVGANHITTLGEKVGDYLELDNPIAKDRPYIRRYLINNLLENIKDNSASRDVLKLFEIGKVFRAEQPGMRTEKSGNELLPRQDTYFTAVYTSAKDKQPFAEVRRIVERLSELTGTTIAFTEPKDDRVSQHPTRRAELRVGDTKVGAIYELHPAVQEAVGIESRVGVVKIKLSILVEHLSGSVSRYTPLPQFPTVERDIAFLVKHDALHEEIAKAVQHVDPLVKQVELFDVYEGKNVGEGYKSMAYHITYANPAKTLTTEEVDAVQHKLEKILKDKFSATIRS